jgi:hypothetical protein
VQYHAGRFPVPGQRPGSGITENRGGSGPIASIDAKILDEAGLIQDFIRIKTLLIDENGDEGILNALR